MGQTTFSGPVKSDGGFIENSFTTAERDALTPVTGLLIYNTDTNSYEVFGNTAWQPAFTPPAPAAGFPYYASAIQVGVAGLNPMDPAQAYSFAFNPTGTQAAAIASGSVVVYSLTTPWDIRTKGSATYLGMATGSATLGWSFNADGTKLTAFSPNQPGLFYQNFDLAVPYDLSTMLAGSAGMMPSFFDTPIGATFSADGTKLIIAANDGSYTPWVYTYTLGIPFDASTASGSPTSSVNMSSAFTPFNYSGQPIAGFTLDSTGTVAYYSFYSYSGMTPYVSLAEFKLGTAYDFSNITNSYSQRMDTSGMTMVSLNPGRAPVVLTGNSQLYYGVGAMGGNPFIYNNLTALSVPTISTVSPDYGVTGTPVTITGTGFTGATAVTFGTKTTPIIVNTGTVIQVNAPATGSTTAVNVSVTNGAGTGTKTNAYTNPVATTTYSRTIEYNSSGVRVDTMMGSLRLSSMFWNDMNAFNTFTSLPSGTVITLSMSGGPSPITFTTTAPYSSMDQRYYGTFSTSAYYMDDTPVDVTF